MTRRLKLYISDVWRGIYAVEVLIEGKAVSCKKKFIPHSERNKSLKDELIPVKVSDEWLAELDTFEIFSWQKEYLDFSHGTDGLIWNLTFEDGKKIYRGHGINVAHKNWACLMDWLGVLFKEES